LRLLEAGVHPRGRLRPVRGRACGRGPQRLRRLRRPGRAPGRDGQGRGLGQLVTNLYEVVARPSLDEPLLVVTLEGWVDAGLGAAAALAAVLGSIPTELVASFDVDTLLDHRARRPVVRIVDGVNTGLMWPEIQLRAGRAASGKDVLFLVGPEPDHQWRAFATAVAELAGMFAVDLVVGLGAFPAPAPHTRQSR